MKRITTQPNRRHILKGLASTALLLAPTFSLKANQNKSVILGAHLPIWKQNGKHNEKFWEALYDDLLKHNIKTCLILVYRFVHPNTAEIYSNSRYTKAQTPDMNFVDQALITAKRKNMKAILYPVLEIDNEHQIGAIWRGNLNFFGTTLKNFFHNYRRFILNLAKLSTSHGFNEFYIGSELASLSHNISARPFWEQLIYELRTNPKTGMLSLTYAAHWEEYLTYPFWQQLDTISLNAYFPLVSDEQARGLHLPTEKKLEEKLSAKFRELKTFARRFKRPMQISEFGVVKYDQTTARPWQQDPSEILDPYEQVNTYAALFNVIKQQNNWLKSVNLWHWQYGKQDISPYNIANNADISKLIRSFSNNE